MNRLFKRIIGLTLGLSMAVGVGTDLIANFKKTNPIYAEAASVETGYTWATMTAGTNGSSVVVNYNNETESHSAIKVGTSSKGGDMSVTIPAGTTSLKLYAYAWNGVNGLSLNLSAVSGSTSCTISPTSLSLTANSGISGSSPFTFDGTASLSEITLSNVNAETVIKFQTSTTKRFVAWDAQTSSGGSEQPSKITTSTTVSAAANKDQLDLAVSPADTVQLSASVTYEDSGIQSIENPGITWSGNNNNVATISEIGLVTAVGKGTARFTANYAGDDDYYGSSGYIDITVYNSAEVIFNFSSIASANSWTNGTAYTTVEVDGVVITAAGGGNNGKYYTSNNSWRMYSGGSLTITPPSGKSISDVVSTPSRTFSIANDGSNATLSVTSSTEFTNITVTLDEAKVLDSITASITDTSKTWRVNDVVSSTDLTVVPHYTDGTDGVEITDGTGVTVENGTLSSSGNNVVTVHYGGKDTTVNVNAVSSTVVAWAITGSIGETVKGTDYNLDGLTLHAYYDAEKQDEASDAVVDLYELIADPVTAGDTPDPSNTINVEVYLKTDTGHENRLALFEDVAAPIANYPKGHHDNPYSVVEARAAIDAGSNVNEVYATGIVSSIVTAYNAEHGNISYDISDDGSTESAQLRAYRGKSYNGENFTSANDIVVGATVVVCGNLVKYINNNNTIYEFEADNQLVSYSLPDLAGITLSETSLDLVAGESETLVASASPVGASLGEVTWTSSNRTVATVDESGLVSAVSEGSATITATFEEFSNTCTVNVTAIASNKLEKASSISVGDVVLLATDNAKKQLAGVENDIGTTADYVTNPSTSVAPLSVEEGSQENTFALKLGTKYLGWTSGNNLYELDEINDNSSWTITFSGTTPTIKNVADNTRKLQYNTSQPRFACYTSSQTAVSLWQVKSISNLLSSATSYAILQGDETDDGNSVSVDSVSIRFGARIPEAKWNAINTEWPISDYGLMLTQQTKLGTYNSITEAYAAGERFFTVMNKKSGTAPVDYSFYAKIKFSNPENYGVVVCAVPYIVAGGHYYFLDEMTYSVDSIVSDFGEYGSTTLSAAALAVLAGN